MNKVLAFLLFTLLALPLFAQGPSKHTSDLQSVDRLVMAKVDNQVLIDAEMNRRGPGIAPKFAENMEVQVTPETHGTWEYTQDDQAIWRLRVYSANAKSLNLGFTKYWMPEGGALYLYSVDWERVMGPFTPSDNEEHEQLWTPIISGDELVIEIQLPLNKIEELELELTYVNHDFLGFEDMSRSSMSGSCNLDVICGEEDGWGVVDEYRDIIQSVAVISTGGSTFCTGFLINNAMEDCTPYFMTAFHCGINNNNDASLVAYWNYQNSFCREPNTSASGQPGDGQLNDFNSGSVLRASYQPSDFVLVEFDDPISETADGFFAGWSAEDVEATSAIAVHHPSTDEKRISFEDAPTTFTNYLGDTPTSNFTHVRVDDWDIGTTEPGSSGSPVFDQNKRVIGQLHGGFAACENDDPDWYGSFHVSWEGGGTPTTRLKDWLDPLNSGILVLDGKQVQACSYFVGVSEAFNQICAGDSFTVDIEVSEAFTGPVTLDVTGIPAGVTVDYGPNPVNPGGISFIIINTPGILVNDTYQLTVMGTDGTNENSSTVTMEVFNGIPSAPTANFPTNGATEVNTSVTLEWTDSSNAQEYEYELSLDPGFSNVIASGSINNNSVQTPQLDPETQYYWRLSSSNLCGFGPFSPTFTFTTANIGCSDVIATDLPIQISDDGTPTISSTIFVPVTGEITDLNVIDLSGTHSYLEDLVFELTSPEGTTVTLISMVCGSQNDFFISFDDNGSTNIPCPYNDGDTYQPLESLSAFNGEDVQGDWVLTVYDTYDQDGGFLNNWELEFCTVSIASIVANPNTLAGCIGGDYTFEVDVSTGFEGPVTLSILGVPALMNVDISPQPVDPGQSATIVFSDLGVDPGIYNFMIEATDGTTTESEDIALDLAAAPSAPTLNFPFQDAIDVTIDPEFSWEAVPGANNYGFELADNPDFDPVLSDGVIPTNAYILPITLNPATEYFWRVLSISDCGSTESETFSFTTEFPESTLAIEGIRYAIAPIPTSDELLVSFSAPINTDILVELYTVDGRRLQDNVIGSGSMHLTLQLGAYPAGIYLVRLSSQSASSTQRVVVIE